MDDSQLNIELLANDDDEDEDEDDDDDDDDDEKPGYAMVLPNWTTIGRVELLFPCVLGNSPWNMIHGLSRHIDIDLIYRY